MKKIEIIERITDANGSISENILTSWEHKNQFIPEIIRFGELKIYLQEQIVKKNDSDVHLSKYEYDILLLLAKSPGRIFGKEMVYDLVWNEPYYICNIREKIEDDPGQPLYIQTVRGVGYRFNGNLGSE
ncbi:winged helix-turn-helix domain-containing protein [Blautia sp.]|uniref:winged helix-turn-helix domain-containing protein n=1 Tax=Blautia sp. TaxID=1955243 RepID=UPI00352044BE